MGFYIGITTFLCIEHRSQELRKAIQSGMIPLDRLLIETDAPFMKPKFDQNEGNQQYKLITKYLHDKKKDQSNNSKKNKFRSRNEPCLLPALLNTLKMCYGDKYTKQQIAEMTMKTSQQIFGFQ